MTSTSSTGGRAPRDGVIYRLPGVPEETACRGTILRGSMDLMTLEELGECPGARGVCGRGGG